MFFSMGLFDCECTCAISTNVKSKIRTVLSFCSAPHYDRIWSIPYEQSDVGFYGESFDTQHVTVAHCTKKFCLKNHEKVEKIMNIQEYSEKILHLSALLNVLFHMNWSNIRYLTTGKTSKNPRNSAYKYSLSIHAIESSFLVGSRKQFN